MARRAVFAVSVIALGGFGATAACGASGNGAPPTGDAGRADTSQRPAPDSSDDEPSPPRDAATPRDAEAALDDWSDAGTCNSLITTAPFLPVVSVAQPLPPMTGGDVDPGTYELTKLEFFMGADGDAGPPTDLRSQTWRVGPAVDGGLALEVAGASRDINGAVGRGRASFVLTPDAGPSFVMRLAKFCPGPKVSDEVAYTATGTGVGAKLQYTFVSYPILYTFTRR